MQQKWVGKKQSEKERKKSRKKNNNLCNTSLQAKRQMIKQE